VKFSRRRLLFAAMVGAVVLTAWGLSRPHGPTYQGRDVRGWLALESGTDGDKLEEFEFGPDSIPAIRAMGTNAFPELIEIALEGLPKRMILAASLDEHLPGLFEKMPDPFQDWLREWFRYGSHIPNYAMAAVGALRPSAALVFPAFTNAIARSRSPRFLSGEMWAEEYDRGVRVSIAGLCRG
jgi:hypothetical protein